MTSISVKKKSIYWQKITTYVQYKQYSVHPKKKTKKKTKKKQKKEKKSPRAAKPFSRYWGTNRSKSNYIARLRISLSFLHFHFLFLTLTPYYSASSIRCKNNNICFLYFLIPQSSSTALRNPTPQLQIDNSERWRLGHANMFFVPSMCMYICNVLCGVTSRDWIQFWKT